MPQPQHENVALVTGVVALGLFAAPFMKTISNAVFSWWSEPSSTQPEIAKKLERANQLYATLSKSNSESIPLATCQKWKKELDAIATHKSFTSQDEHTLDGFLKEMTEMRIVIKLKRLENELSVFEVDINHLERDGYWLTSEMRIELQEARRSLRPWKKALIDLKKLGMLSEIEEKEIDALVRNMALLQENKLNPIKVALGPQCLDILFGRIPVPPLITEPQSDLRRMAFS